MNVLPTVVSEGRHAETDNPTCHPTSLSLIHLRLARPRHLSRASITFDRTMSTPTDIKNLVKSYVSQEMSLDIAVELLAAPIEAMYDHSKGHNANASEADDALQEVWMALFRMVKDMPHDAEQHRRMFQLFQSLQARARPSTSSGLKNREPWRSGGL